MQKLAKNKIDTYSPVCGLILLYRFLGVNGKSFQILEYRRIQWVIP